MTEMVEKLRAWSDVSRETGHIGRAEDLTEAADRLEYLERLHGRPQSRSVPRKTADDLPDQLPWHPAQLFAWGESLLTGQERWQRSWSFEEEHVTADNPEGTVYEIRDPDCKVIYQGTDPEEGDRITRDAIMARYPEIFEATGAPEPS
jgi:hypothetical protein